MKGKIILSLCFLTLVSLRPKAQSNCNCWPVRDTSYHIVPFLYAAPPYYRNDDDYTGYITLPFNFCFYGTSVNQIYISNNGYITWGTNGSSIDASATTYEPEAFPNSLCPMVAPFWADVYTLSLGLVWYSMTSTHLVVQFDSVGGFGLGNSSIDDFEVIITDGTDPIIPNNNNVEFCYGQMQWCMGTASGGSSSGFWSSGTDGAVVGINKGDGTTGMQLGQFGEPNTSYFGPNPAPPFDGVYWLDTRSFILNACTGNSPPELGGVTMCPVDTFYVCEGDTLKVPLGFYSLITGAIVNSSLYPPVPPGVSIIYNVSGVQRDSLIIQVVGSASNVGYNTVDFYGYDNLGDTNRAWFVFEVSPSPAVTIHAVPDTLCLGSSSTISAGGGLTYLWSTGSTDSVITVTPTVTTTYSIAIATHTCTKDTTITVVVEPRVALTVSPANTGACEGTSITLTASGSTSYNWAPNTGLSCYTCATTVATPTATTIYTISTSATGCVSNTTDTVTVYPVPTLTITSSGDSICAGHSVNLSVSGTATSYTWTPSTGLSCTSCTNPVATPTVSTVYTVLGTNAEGCSASASVLVYVTPLPEIAVSPNVSICPGESASLYATGNGTSFTWTPGNETGPSITVNPASTQTYTVTIASACRDTFATVTVNVNPQPVPLFSADINSGCVPLCIQFRNTSTIASGSIKTWGWDFGNGDTSSSKNPIFCYPYPGVYSVKITTTSDSGCSASLTMNDLITVYSHPNVSFSASPQPTTILQPTISFTSNTTDAYGIAGTVWNFGDGTDSVSYLQNPSHTYQDTGTYCVHLDVTNIHGCIDSSTDCLVISPIYCLYIPDAFSPNGDGVNDMFMAKGSDVKSFEMYIFDRWGLQLFHSTNINSGWNGRMNSGGSICQEDAYYYLITVYDDKNIKHSYMGSLNLIK